MIVQGASTRTHPHPVESGLGFERFFADLQEYKVFTSGCAAKFAP